MIVFIIQLIIFIYLAFVVAYIVIFSVSGKLFGKSGKLRTQNNADGQNKRFAIMVPAYKEDAVIYSTAISHLQLNYPRDLYDIYIIADSLQSNTVDKLKELDVNVIEVSFEKSTKTKALNKAFEQIQKIYDVALICDADNVLKKDFLLVLNTAFSNGAKAVQGQRVAKNMNNAFSILDAASEMVNNHIFRKGANALGLSAPVIGSGMAFDYALIRKAMSRIKAVGGFDKVLQLELATEKIKIKYLEEAIIFDEKIEHPEAFGNQRRRWLSTQLIYMKKYFFPGMKALLRGDMDYFNFAVLNNIVLPRVFVIVLLPLLLVISVLLSIAGFSSTFPWLWAGLAVVYYLSLVIAVPLKFYNKQLLTALMSLPKAVLVMLSSLLRLKGADQAFIHTIHTSQEINNPLFSSDEI